MRKKEKEERKESLKKVSLTLYQENEYRLIFSSGISEVCDKLLEILGQQIRSAAFEISDNKSLGMQAFIILRAFLATFEKAKFGNT